MEQAGPFLEQCSGHSFVTMNTVPEDLAPTTLLPGMELCDLRIGASVPALFFTIPLQEAALVTIHFQEFNTASRCILLASSRDSHPTTETAIWRLSSPLPVKTMTIHPADDNYSLGQLFFCVRYLEENGSTFVRLHVTLDRDYSALWYHRTRRALRSGPALSILSRQTVRRPATATATSSPQISAGEYSGEFSPVFNTNHHHSTAPTSYVSRRSGAQSDSVTCGCLYIGQWKGAKFNGRGTAFYSVTDTAESLMRQQPLLLIRTVFERHTLPWSAQTLPEDPTELCALDVRSITGIQAVEDIRNASGWCIIKPLQEGMEVYDGEWVHGRKEGFGVYQWKDRAYVGEWRSGMREGFGSLEKADGSWYRGGWHLDHCHGDGEALLLPSNTRYKGAWEGGLREGRGTLAYPNGVVIEGTWVKDVLQVRISAAYPDGVHYVGGWKDSYRHGDGVLTDELGCVHQNNWDHDRRTGEGSIELFNGVLFKGTWEDDAVVDGAYYFPDGDVYAGDWDGVQCIREGSGKCTSKNGDRYDGEWHCDQHHGKGTMLYADQLSKYEGDWAKNKRHGYGTLTDAEGVYEGHFEADVRSGEGVQRSPDGSHYVGSWKDNHRAGRGVYYSAKDDMTYEGIFLHDRLQGVGKSVHQTNHDQYEGTWLDGKRQGYGTYTLPNGDVMRGIWHRGKHQDGQVQYDFATGKYVGDWHNSMRHGRGTQVNTDGTVYEGEWVNNLPHGRGRLTKADGETLECLWKEGEMTDGVGVLTSIDGSVYRGELRGSTPHGRGELTYPDGTTFSGLFTDGIYEL